MKDIKDYLHLYLGCEVETTVSHKFGSYAVRAKLIGVVDFGNGPIFTTRPFDIYGKPWDENYDTKEVKPILRKLSSMTDEEIDEVWHSHEPQDVLTMNYSDGRNVRKVSLTAERTRYLLSRGFDLFGLIDSGLSIENQS